MFVSKKYKAPKIFWVKINFETSQTPSLYPPDTHQTLSRHLLGTLHTPLRHPPNFSLLYWMKVSFPTRAVGCGVYVVGRLRSLCVGWSPLHNHATSWSNLRDCKISSRAEIPKLDRVWQFSKRFSI